MLNISNPRHEPIANTRAAPKGADAKLTNVCALDFTAPPIQRRYCDRRRTVWSPFSQEPVEVPCGNYHHSVQDFRLWARRLAACLRLSWSERPPDGTLRVTASCLDEVTITRVERKFLGRLQRRGVSYAWFKEWASPGTGRHLHLAVRTIGTRLKLEDVGALWQASLPDRGRGSTYAAEVRNFIGLGRYLTKDLNDDRIVLPPPEVRFIFYARRDFLVRPLARLKQEVKAEWRTRRQMRDFRNSALGAHPESLIQL